MRDHTLKGCLKTESIKGGPSYLELERELWKQKRFFQRFPRIGQKATTRHCFCHLQFNKHYENLQYSNSHLSLHKEGIEMFVWKQKTFAFIIVQTLRVIRIF